MVPAKLNSSFVVPSLKTVKIQINKLIKQTCRYPQKLNQNLPNFCKLYPRDR